MKDDLTGKTVIVVGANIGLNFEGDYPLPPILPSHCKGLRFAAALKLAAMNPKKLILTVRCKSKGKGEKALQSECLIYDSHSYSYGLAVLKESTGCNSAEIWPLDLGDYSSISNFVERFDKEGGGRLDILLLSAGVSTKQFEFSKEGWETT